MTTRRELQTLSLRYIHDLCNVTTRFRNVIHEIKNKMMTIIDMKNGLRHAIDYGIVGICMLAGT